MYKIKTDESYNERFASLSFVDGEATTDDPWLAAWCEGRGFLVEKIPKADVDALQELSGKRGKKNDKENVAGQGEASASDGIGIGA